MSAIKSLITGLVLFIAFIFIFILFINPLGDPTPPPSINDIQNTVINNKALFEDAVSYIKEIKAEEKYIQSIGHTKYYTLEDSSINGLFIRIDGQSTETPLESQTLEKLFLEKEVRYISIYYNYIEFEFEGGGRNYYCGAVWTEDGNPVGYGGLVAEGKGWSWKEENGDNKYYTEKIEDNWFVYTQTY